MTAKTNTLMEVIGLKTVFESQGGLFGKKKQVVAVDNVSFSIGRGEILGITGASGSGKSTLARSVLRLVEPTSGDIFFDGDDVRSMNRPEMQQFRCRAQIIFQDPGAALRSDWTVGRILAEPVLYHGLTTPKDLNKQIQSLLEAVELPCIISDRYAFELSGGQRQRLVIARALSLKPSLLIADEALSALDLSIQASMLRLFSNLRDRLGLSILHIAHDLEILSCLSDRIAVMEQGQIVEIGNPQEMLTKPQHPATQRLAEASS